MSSPCTSSFRFPEQGRAIRNQMSLSWFRGALPLSDDEWALVRPLMERQGYSDKGESYRPVLDALVRMFALRKRWSKADFDGCLAGYAHYVYMCWRKDGLWDEIVETLRQHAFEHNAVKSTSDVEVAASAV